MRLLPAPFRDDLGRRVPAAVVTPDAIRLVKQDAVQRRMLQGLRRERGHENAFLAVLILVAAMAMTSLTERWAPLRAQPPEVSFIMFLAAAALAVSMLKRWLVALIPSHRPGQTRQRFLDALLCPACAHDLKGLPPRADGITVCPECGAAWRVEGTQGQRDTGTEGMGE